MYPKSRSSFPQARKRLSCLGEAATTVVAPAIGNAIFAASDCTPSSSANPSGSRATSARAFGLDSWARWIESGVKNDINREAITGGLDHRRQIDGGYGTNQNQESQIA
jgi:hypothetical protein